MFYAHFVLAKRGPLAKIWLAAHWDKKLTKSHVFETNIESSVEGILQPKVKMALRTSGHLLLGIVRIYSRKAKYLLADCNEAFIKIKMAFRPGVVDLPEGNREAAVATITLPEVFHDFDSAMPDITIDMDAQVNLNQSRAEDITLKEEYGNLCLMNDDGGFDMSFEPEAARDATNIDDGFEHASLLLCEESTKERAEETIEGENMHNNSASKVNVSIDPRGLKSDGFGGSLGEGLLDGETGSLFEPAGLFDDAPLDHVSLENAEQNVENIPNEKPPDEKCHEEDSDDDMYDMGPASMGAPSPPSSPESPRTHLNTNVHEPTHADVGLGSEPNGGLDLADTGRALVPGACASATDFNIIPGVTNEIEPSAISALPFDHTTLINNEEESFALAPLDASIVEGSERTVKAKRKRKLIVDEVKNISGEEMKLQLADTSDIVVTLDLAPPTKRLMHWKETGGVEKLFALPGHIILSKTLSKAYQMHLTTRSVENEEFGLEEEDSIDLDADLEQGRDENEIGTVSRKRRREVEPMLSEDLQPHLDTLHLESSRPSYSDGLTHPSFEVTNFLQSQHMFPPSSAQQIPEQQMMPNVMSVMSHPPPAHMIQQMLQSDVNQLSHIPQIMHPMVDQGPPLHTINPSIHTVPSHPPVVSEAYNQGMHQPVMEPVSQHLLAETIPQIADHLHHSELPTRAPLDERLSETPLQNQLTQPADHHAPCVENTLNTCVNSNSHPTMQPHNDNEMLQNSPIDDDVTQPCLGEDYAREPPALGENEISDSKISGPTSDVLPHNEISNAPTVNDQMPESNSNLENCAVTQNEDIVPEVTDAQCNSNLIFDSLNNGEVEGPNLHTVNTQDHDHDQQEKNNDFPLSDDDDYGEAPPSVGPALPEEQMADETYEQFEERILVKRTTHMLHIIHSRLDRDKNVSFGDLVRGCKRKQVAQKFYTFLVLKKLEAVELRQNQSYGDLVITRGVKFNAVYNGN